jgi:hypothetical protein
MNPTAVTASMYPATVLFPDGTQHNRCKVFATPEGLAVYFAVPTDGVTPDWFSPIDYANTQKPRSGYSARLGWDVYTEAGTLTVTAEGGCGCGWPLKRWMPQFARTRLAWPRSVSVKHSASGTGSV